MVASRDRQELVDALAKTGSVLLPQQIVQKYAHGVHAHGFGPSEFLVDLRGIEGGFLPHLQFVDRRFRDIVAANEPGLLCVPIVSFLFGPACGLGEDGSGAKDHCNQGERQECGSKFFHRKKSECSYKVLGHGDTSGTYLLPQWGSRGILRSA